jgi:thiosulfate sulfurtransferase
VVPEDALSFKRINADQAQVLMENGATVIDIRDAASYQSGHIPGAEHVTDANAAAFAQQADRAKPLIVCCYHGNMSQGAAEYFSRSGFGDTYSLDGGYEGWRLWSSRR